MSLYYVFNLLYFYLFQTCGYFIDKYKLLLAICVSPMSKMVLISYHKILRDIEMIIMICNAALKWLIRYSIPN